MPGTVEQLLAQARSLCTGKYAETSRIVDTLLDIRNATDRALIHLKTDVALSLLRGTSYVNAEPMLKIVDEMDACWQLDPVFKIYDDALAARDEIASES